MKISGDELVHDKEDMKEIKLIEEFRGNRVREVLDERVAQSKNLCDLMKPFQGGIRTNLFNRHNRPVSELPRSPSYPARPWGIGHPYWRW